MQKVLEEFKVDKVESTFLMIQGIAKYIKDVKDNINGLISMMKKHGVLDLNELAKDGLVSIAKDAAGVKLPVKIH